MSHIIRFLVFIFYLLAPFFRSVPAAAEPKISEERRLTVITPSSSGEQRSGQRGPAPPGAPSSLLLQRHSRVQV